MLPIFLSLGTQGMASHLPLLSVDLFLCGCTELHTVFSEASLGQVRFVFVIGMWAGKYVHIILQYTMCYL
jgi:hypothetical protein